MKIIFRHLWTWQTQLDSSVCVDNITVEVYNNNEATNGIIKNDDGSIMKFDSKASVYRWLLEKSGIKITEIHRVG